MEVAEFVRIPDMAAQNSHESRYDNWPGGCGGDSFDV
jgi:hypothetical protein